MIENAKEKRGFRQAVSLELAVLGILGMQVKIKDFQLICRIVYRSCDV
ncbi:MAG: hypothetical protein WA113_00985 [Desulfitobacteriaceae bacterium]